MSKQTVPDVVLAERRRILAILYRADVKLPGPAAVAINRGQDARSFCPGRDEETVETAANAEPAIATAAGKRPWSEIAARFNAQRRAAVEAEPTQANEASA